MKFFLRMPLVCFSALFFCAPSMTAPVVENKYISAVYGRWLAESNGDNRVDFFWIDGSKKSPVRSIAVSKKKFGFNEEPKPLVDEILWCNEGRYLVIVAQERMYFWDSDYNVLLEDAPKKSLSGN